MIPDAVEEGTEEMESTIKVRRRSKSSISIATETLEVRADLYSVA